VAKDSTTYFTTLANAAKAQLSVRSLAPATHMSLTHLEHLTQPLFCMAAGC
jgi:hypothetical protein